MSSSAITPSSPSCTSPASPATPPPASPRACCRPISPSRGMGDVTAPVVYANYGMPDDYKALERAGIDVRGKIVITRYGGGWRGLKPQLAQEHGAIGCLIYSDPADDGYGPADPYPKGGSRPPDGVQRGSVEKMMIFAGDPLTPRRRRHGARQAPDPRDLADHPEDPGPADLLRRRHAALASHERPGGAEELPRATADHLSHGSVGGAGASSGEVGLEPEADLRRHRRDEGLGIPGSVGGARQPPRRLGLWRVGPPGRQRRPSERGAVPRRAGQDRLAAQAHHRLRQLGRRGAGPDGLHRMGRRTRGRAAEESRRLCELRHQREGVPRR